MHESPEQDDDEALDRALTSSSCRPWIGARLFRRLSGVNVIDFNEALPSRPEMPPHRKIILLTLLLAIKYKASELRFEPWESEADGRSLQMFCEADGRLLEMVPPPACLTDSIVWELRTIAGFHSPRGRLIDSLRHLARKLEGRDDDRPRSRFWPRSRFRMRGGDDEVEISVTIYSSQAGDRIFLRFAACPAVLAERAGMVLARILARRRRSES